ncbi:MAG TPA: class I SAM-dependent methyltransferase [Steroidobacteraceae bacterium]|nr:class I SAM-dependent methyltransferase [Steroidobacteraceae bacterium]
MLSSTERFSTRVENYIRYRPGYPAAVLDLLRVRCGLTAAATVADVGSGTGILTELLLETGAAVYAVEPNREMRAAAERLLSDYGRFRSVNGTAEATTLPDACVDLITASQAFHWFDVPPTRREFRRILRPGGWVVLIWNERPLEASPFLDDYESLLRRHAAEYDQVTSRRADEAKIREFFGRAPETALFANRQTFDFAGLEGRLMSSSYAPEPGHPEHAPMIAGLRDLFERHNRAGKVNFPYRTLVYFGQLD